MVVEDDPSIRQIVAYALRDEGYHVDEARDGHAALELVGQQHPDVILLDMKMPGMDGWEFAKLYREQFTHRAPIIVFTAARDAAQRALEIEARDYVAKPFDLNVLVERISAIVRIPGID